MKQKEPSEKTAEFSVAKKLSVYGTTEPRYFFTSSGWFWTASEKEQKMMPTFASCSRKVVATETRVEDRVDGDAGELRALAQRNAELLVGLEELRVDVVERLRPVLPRLGRRVVDDRLVVDRRVVDVLPGRLLHREPVAVGLQAPLEQPLRLVLLGGDQPDDVFVQARAGSTPTRCR